MPTKDPCEDPVAEERIQYPTAQFSIIKLSTPQFTSYHFVQPPHRPEIIMANFENKVVIVTGCSSGIGLATTRLFLERQAKVFGIDISTFKEELSAAHSNAFTFHEVDLTIAKAADDAVAACIIKYGRKIDVLINCAGISDGWSSADTIKDSEWERVMAINLTVPVRLMTAVLPSMKEHKSGAIVNVASKAGVSGASSGIAYTASKHGLVCHDSWFEDRHLTSQCRSAQQRTSHGDSTTTVFAATLYFLEVTY
jgi:NADP-dependent 3-hydroxy acid dehydrogenase YdfG